MKIKVYEKQWHNIPFNELDIELSLTQKADLNFYDKFYNVFFKRYKSYNELSKTWLEGKTEVAQLIEKNIQEKSKVLSYGCGIGFIEKYISNKRKDITLDCYDFSNVSSMWLKNIEKLNFTTNNKNLKKYDIIYMVELLYSLDDKEIIFLLKELKELLNEKGKIIVSNTSLNPKENGLVQSNYILKLFTFFKNYLRPFYYFLLKNKKIQFWGYQRNKIAYEKLFKSAGYVKDINFSGSKKLFQIFKI